MKFSERYPNLARFIRMSAEAWEMTLRPEEEWPHLGTLATLEKQASKLSQEEMTTLASTCDSHYVINLQVKYDIAELVEFIYDLELGQNHYWFED